MAPAENTAIRAYAETISKYEPAAAAQWAMSLPPGKDRDQTLKSIYQNWPTADHGGFLHGSGIIGPKEIAPFWQPTGKFPAAEKLQNKKTEPPLQAFSCLHSPAKTRFRMAEE